MQILVDADACPVVVKDMLFRAAQRVQVSVTLVANHFMRTPPSRFIKGCKCPPVSTSPISASSNWPMRAIW
jgi:uncharacterized protein YaiI (UPF0178 family)